MHPRPADLPTNCVQCTGCYVGVARATRGDNKADHHSSQLQPRPGQHTINHQPPVLLLGIITHSLVALSCTNTGYGCINPVDLCGLRMEHRSPSSALSKVVVSAFCCSAPCMRRDPGPWLWLCWALCVGPV